MAQYLYGLEEAPLLMERDFDGDGVLEASEQYLFHTGVLGNVEALTDRDGYVVERYDYGDFGAPVVLTPSWELRGGSQYDNPFLFNGQYFDEESNLYYYRLRYLDPLTGRFISHDPLGIWGDPENAGNPYAYVGNNPWSRVDPFGLEGGTEWWEHAADPESNLDVKTWGQSWSMAAQDSPLAQEIVQLSEQMGCLFMDSDARHTALDAAGVAGDAAMAERPQESEKSPVSAYEQRFAWGAINSSPLSRGLFR